MTSNPTRIRIPLWPLPAATGLSVLTLVLTTFYVWGFHEDSLRWVLRHCARLSFVIFVLIFIASPWHRLCPSPVTGRLLEHRASLGLAFAVSHFSMGAAILIYRLLYPQSFYEVTYSLQRIGGSIGFAAIAVMTATTFNKPKSWLSAKHWKQTHTTCLYIIFINFFVSEGRRTLLHHDTFYIPFFFALLVALVLRILPSTSLVRSSTNRSDPQALVRLHLSRVKGSFSNWKRR